MIKKREVKKELFSIIGKPKGDILGLITVEEKLSKFLINDVNIKSAFLLLVKFGNENLRLGLFVNNLNDTKESVNDLFNFCFEHIGEIDIFLMKDLNNDLVLQIKTKYLPFFQRKINERNE